MSASSRTETASDPLRDSVDKAFVAPLRCMTVVHMSDWKPVKKTPKRREVTSSESSSLAPTFTPFVEGWGAGFASTGSPNSGRLQIVCRGFPGAPIGDDLIGDLLP